MKVFITGGTGFVGKSLAPSLSRAGHEVTVLSRSGKGAGKLLAGVSLIEGDPTQKGSWQAAARDHDIVINLAGPSIFTRWTDSAKLKNIGTQINADLRDQNRKFRHRNPLKNMPYFILNSAIGLFGLLSC
jgi:nucleoside-diphosphate-sugar epimerase